MAPPTIYPQIRFWSKVDKSGGPDACWPWTGATHRSYGSFWVSRRHNPAPAHRVSLGWAIGRPLTPEEQACHRCDNPPCVNPAHLFVGDQAANNLDMWAKGRTRPNPMTPEMRVKVSEGQRAAYARGRQNQNSVKTHCVHGHEFTPGNTYTWRSHRVCRACGHAKDKRYKERLATA